jgi:hypothetical protein
VVIRGWLLDLDPIIVPNKTTEENLCQQSRKVVLANLPTHYYEYVIHDLMYAVSSSDL